MGKGLKVDEQMKRFVYVYISGCGKSSVAAPIPGGIMESTSERGESESSFPSGVVFGDGCQDDSIFKLGRPKIKHSIKVIWRTVFGGRVKCERT